MSQCAKCGEFFDNVNQLLAHNPACPGLMCTMCNGTGQEDEGCGYRGSCRRCGGSGRCDRMGNALKAVPSGNIPPPPAGKTLAAPGTVVRVYATWYEVRPDGSVERLIDSGVSDAALAARPSPGGE